MCKNTILALPAGVNDSEIMFDGEVGGKPAVLSTNMADRFNKNHKDLLRAIDSLISILPESFARRNFAPSEYYDPTGRRLRAYLLTRDAFSLLAMGLTGKAAIIWKLRYIEAFNALEQAALESHAELAREAGYLAGRQEALCLPAMEAERKKGYLAGLKEGRRLAGAGDRLRVLERIYAYLQKGLNHAEIGKIVGLSASAVSHRVSRAKRLGFWPRDCKTAQAALPGVAQ